MRGSLSIFVVCTALLAHYAHAKTAPPSLQAICQQVHAAMLTPLPPAESRGSDEDLIAHVGNPAAPWAALTSLRGNPNARMLQVSLDLERAGSPTWFAPGTCGTVRPLCNAQMGHLRSQLYQIMQGPVSGAVIALDISENLGMRSIFLTFYTPTYMRAANKLDLLDQHACAVRKLPAARSGG